MGKSREGNAKCRLLYRSATRKIENAGWYEILVASALTTVADFGIGDRERGDLIMKTLHTLGVI